MSSIKTMEEFFIEIDRVVVNPLHLSEPIDIGKLKEFFGIFGPWEEFKKIIENFPEDIKSLEGEIEDLIDAEETFEDQLKELKEEINDIIDDLDPIANEYVDSGLDEIIKKLQKLT